MDLKPFILELHIRYYAQKPIQLFAYFGQKRQKCHDKPIPCKMISLSSTFDKPMRDSGG